LYFVLISTFFFYGSNEPAAINTEYYFSQIDSKVTYDKKAEEQVRAGLVGPLVDVPEDIHRQVDPVTRFSTDQTIVTQNWMVLQKYCTSQTIDRPRQ
jgi:hypothetical protein